jgi:hypothetical protein
VPLPFQTLSDDIARLAQEAMDCQRALLSWRKNGWKINGKGIAPPFTVPAGIATRELGRAKVRWGVYIITPGAKLVRLDGASARSWLVALSPAKRTLPYPRRLWLG